MYFISNHIFSQDLLYVLYLYRPVVTMKLYIAFILVLISYIAASPIAKNDDAQQQQMANLMDGRSLGECEDRCNDLYNQCVDGGNTGKYLSEALIFASTNPQYDNRLLIELQVQYMKIPSSNLGRT
jgi:hypothetical protein